MGKSEKERTALDVLFEDFFNEIGKHIDKNGKASVVVTKIENGEILGGVKGTAEDISRLLCEVLIKHNAIFECFMNFFAESVALEDFIGAILLENPDLLHKILHRLSGGKMIAVPINGNAGEVAEKVEQEIEKLKMEREYGKPVGEA